MEELDIEVVGLTCTHHLVLVSCLMQAQVHLFQLFVPQANIINQILASLGFARISGLCVCIPENFCLAILHVFVIIVKFSIRNITVVSEHDLGQLWGFQQEYGRLGCVCIVMGG